MITERALVRSVRCRGPILALAALGRPGFALLGVAAATPVDLPLLPRAGRHLAGPLRPPLPGPGHEEQADQGDLGNGRRQIDGGHRLGLPVEASGDADLSVETQPASESSGSSRRSVGALICSARDLASPGGTATT